MSYEATCPKGHRLQVTEAHFGERVTCPACGEAFVVPDLGKAPGPATPPHPTVKTGSDTRRWKPSADSVAALTSASLVAGRPLVALGLVLVLLARGCDEVGRRGVERAEMKAKAARDSFDNQWQTQQIELEGKIAAIEENKEPRSPEAKTADAKAVADLRAQLADLERHRAIDKRQDETGPWRSLDIAARTARSGNQIDAYWRQIFFVFASIVLASGLLVVS